MPFLPHDPSRLRASCTYLTFARSNSLQLMFARISLCSELFELRDFGHQRNQHLARAVVPPPRLRAKWVFVSAVLHLAKHPHSRAL